MNPLDVLPPPLSLQIPIVYTWYVLPPLERVQEVNFEANAGDSRTVLGRKGHAIALSKDHKPYEESNPPFASGDINRQVKRLGSRRLEDM